MPCSLRRLGEQEQRHRGGADQRGLGVPHDVRECAGDLLRPDVDDVVVGAERLRDLLLVGALVVMRVLERDGERPQLVVGGLLGQRCGQAGVQAARQVRADRHVRAQAQLDAGAHERLQVAGLLRTRRVVGLPPRALGDDPAALPHDELARREHPHAAEGGARRARGPRREDVVDAAQVGLGSDLTGREERLGLRPEDDRSVVEQRPVQRMDAEPVAHEREPARLGLPPGERELAVQPVERGEAVALQQPQDDLGVGRGLQVDPVARELGPQLVVIEDLAVVDDERPAVRRLHRLPAVGDVEDGQAGGREPRALPEREPEPVGSAVADRPRHPAQGDLLHRPRAIRAHDAGDAAHVSRPRR